MALSALLPATSGLHNINKCICLEVMIHQQLSYGKYHQLTTERNKLHQLIIGVPTENISTTWFLCNGKAQLCIDTYICI